MKPLSGFGKKKITLDEIREYQKLTDYAALVDYIRSQLTDGVIMPVKSSGTNGKRPALFLAYHIIDKKQDYGELTDELSYRLVPGLSPDYYLEHPEEYKKDRNAVLALNSYLAGFREELGTEISLNERSFAIWGREKFLQKEGGMRILKNLNLGLRELSVYGTAEPIACYSRQKTAPQEILILENKDTFYSMRKYLTDGGERIFGREIKTLIYGAGKGICRSFAEYPLCLEPYLTQKENIFLYFGDLDYEGLGIYESLVQTAERLQEPVRIQPLQAAYTAMVEKADRLKALRNLTLPDTKEGQNRNAGNRFLSWFRPEEQVRMREILGAGRYIPQEILTVLDFAQKTEEEYGVNH